MEGIIITAIIVLGICYIATINKNGLK